MLNSKDAKQHTEMAKWIVPLETKLLWIKLLWTWRKPENALLSWVERAGKWCWQRWPRTRQRLNQVRGILPRSQSGLHDGRQGHTSVRHGDSIQRTDLFVFNWVILDVQRYICFTYTSSWFHICRYCEMITYITIFTYFLYSHGENFYDLLS